MAAVIDVDIGAAHADPPDAHEHFVIARDGFGDLPELDGAGHGHDSLSHHVSFSTVPRGSRAGLTATSKWSATAVSGLLREE
jgi:hypothetical protein